MKVKTYGWMKGVGSAIALLAIASCSVTQQPNASTTAQTTSPDSSSSNLSVSDSSKVAVAQGIQKTTVAEGLDHPWSLAWLPDGSMLITERLGQLRILRNGQLDPTPIAGVPEVLVGGQAGLMDVSVHPRFAENRLVYLTYSHGTEQANRTRLARATFDGKSLSNLQVIFEVSPTKSGLQHFGSRIVWLPDSTMLLAIGDGGNPPIQLNGELIRQQAQNRRSRLGKIVRLNDDGSIPQDNPFVKSTDAEPAIWSYGHRNIQGLTFDPVNKRIWATEHGSQGGDELNLVQAGENYGWPIVTYSREYSGEEITKERSRPGMVDPKLVWTPSIAPSGLAFYSGDKFPQWQGDLFAGGLVSQDVRHIDLDAQGNVVNQQAIEIGQRVRDVRQSPDGLLYVLTDDNNGQLIRLEPSRG
ncbi:MAG: Aldose sugar dehydrogenase YliI [Chroococcidiopsis sp. SAG 2025]|uniref:PQQ-dependent sugar dehydrogenase n=1 Tax=Chroococcidiopsis sp. SAG 2025 TaxID=171389 RepID=UPI0029373CBE|nr:PQQ-dependent sugar dehydrogenase [Chroococcidiopsis sp. SAG 2025]MDV2991094.1 Aldose sugar dehydrogenase YliI [Chroococcidiopsis sp. SAG 2025]